MMDNLELKKQSSSLKVINTSTGSALLLSDRLSSLNFNGTIPRDNALVYASDLKVGQTIFTSDPTAEDNSFFITAIQEQTVTVEGVEESSYLLYFLGESILEEPYIYGAENEDGSFSQNHLFSVYKDDISDIALGTDGWMITNQGNAVFSNVFVRGKIEATSGKIDGILNVGEDVNGSPLVTIGKNIFTSAPFEGNSSEHNGIFLNKNNYLMGYEQLLQSIPILSVVAENLSTNIVLRKATFTLQAHPLVVGDQVSIFGFVEDKFLELDNVFTVAEITTNTFTVYYKEPIAGTTNPISVNLKVESFALDNIYDITQLSLSESTTADNRSSLKVYYSKENEGTFIQGSSVYLSGFTNVNLPINGSYLVESVFATQGEENPDYLVVRSENILPGTYTTGMGTFNIYNNNYKFKVGDDDNSMSYNSYTGSLSVTGIINAKAGNFTGFVNIGQGSVSYEINNKELLNNVAILTTTDAHSFVVGNTIVVSNIDNTFNGTYTVLSVPTPFTFSYDKIANPVTSIPVSPVGTATRGESQNGTLNVGYGANQISIDGTNTAATSAIYAGAGAYGDVDTGFYMDASGRFSLKDKLTFTSAGDLTVSGTINASAGNFTGFVTAGTMKIGKDVNSTNDGVYINATNYWYDDGKFSLGSGTKKIYFDGTDVKITSDVIIEGGVTATSFGIDANNYWNTSGNEGDFRVGNESTYMFWNKTGTDTGTLQVRGQINATSGTIDGDFQINGDAVVNGSVFVGGSPTTGQRVAINDSGIIGVDNSNITVFNLPATGTDKPTMTNFNILEAKITGAGSNAYLIAGTTGVDATNIVVRGDKTGGQAAAIYSTISGTATSATTGNGFYLDDTGKFRFAQGSNVITGSGGNLSVTGTINATAGYIGGTTSGWLINSNLLSNVSVGLFAPAIKNGTVVANGTINPVGSTTLTTASASITPKVGMSINNNDVLPIGTYITAVTGTDPYTITFSNPAKISHDGRLFTISEYAIYAGNATRWLAPFKVDYLGNLSASNANITGTINATSGSFTGTVVAETGAIGRPTGSNAGGWLIGPGYLTGGGFQNVGLFSPDELGGATHGIRKNIMQNPSLEKSLAGYVAIGGASISRINTDAYSGSYCLQINKVAGEGSGVSLYQNSGERYPITPPIIVSSSGNAGERFITVASSSGISVGMTVYGANSYGSQVTGISGNRIAIADPVTTTFSGQNVTFKKIYIISMYVKVPSGNEDTKVSLNISRYTASGTYYNGNGSAPVTVTSSDGWKLLSFFEEAQSLITSFDFYITTGPTDTAGQKLLVDSVIIEPYSTSNNPKYFDGDTLYNKHTKARWSGEPGLSESDMSAIAFFAGSSFNTSEASPFIVGYDGYLNATNANITGEIKATSGYIGGTTSGWNITSSLLSNETVGLFAPTSALTTGTGTISSKTNAVTAVSSPQTAIAMTNYIGNGTTTATGTSATNHGLVAGDDIFISGAVGTEQVKLNGNRRILSVPTPTTFTFTAQASVASGTYTTGIGTTTTVKTAVYTATGHSFIPGDIVLISGANVAAYNGTFTITAVATNTFTVANKATSLVGFTSGLAVSINSAILTTTGFVPAINMSITGTNIAPGAYITAVSGSGPYTLTLSKLSIGILSGTANVSSYAIYAGSAERQLAPFKVDYFGNLTATDANITGVITATSGTIGGFNIPSNDPYRLESTITQLDTGIKKITLDSTLDSIGVLNRINVVETSYQTRPSSIDGSYAIYSTGLGYTLSYPVTVTSVQILGNAPKKTIIYSVTTNPEQISAGDSVTISGLSGDVAPLNTMDVVVSSKTTTTITVTNYNTSIANGTYGLQSGTIGPLSTPYLIADSTAYTDTGGIEGYVFTAITSDVGLEYGSDAGPNIILGKTRLGDVGLSSVSAIDGSPDVMYIQPGGGITEFGGLIGTSLNVVRPTGTQADLTAGVVINNTGWVWAHRNGTATNSSIYATSGYVAGAWRGIQFLRSLTANATMANTGYISVPLSTTVAPSFAAGSDYRLKENIRTADDNFIDKISSLRLVRFDEIAVEENTNQLGFIAHEVQEIIPEAIEGEKDAVDENGDPDYQHIMQIRILPYLVGALQESIKKVEDLENRLAALES